MLLKTIHQWDLNSMEDLEKFQEESLEIHRQAERAIYRRCDNVVPGNMVTREWKDPRTGETLEYETRGNSAIPFMGREEFLAGIAQDMEAGFLFEDEEEYPVYTEFLFEDKGDDTFPSCRSNLIGDFHYPDPPGRVLPRPLMVRATVEHRNGAPVRAEFLETRGEPLAERPDPNAGGIIDAHFGRSAEDMGFVVEDSNGDLRVDYQMFSRARNTCQNEGIEGLEKMTPGDHQALNEATRKACIREMDNPHNELLPAIKFLMDDP